MKIPIISNMTCLAIIACAAPVDIFFLAKDEAGKGMAAFLATCGIAGLVVIFRQIWGNWRFWAMLTAIAVANIVAINLIPWGSRVEFGALYAPIAIVLFYVAGKLVLRVVGETDGS